MKKQRKIEQKDIRQEIEKKIANKTKENHEYQKSLEQLLSWKYDYLVDTKLPTKSSVTKIKEEKMKIDQIQEVEKSIETFNQKEIDIENNDKETNQKNSNTNVYMPKFMQENIKITSAEKGTLIHLCIQKIDEKKDYTLQDIKNMIQEET